MCVCLRWRVASRLANVPALQCAADRQTTFDSFPPLLSHFNKVQTLMIRGSLFAENVLV